MTFMNVSLKRVLFIAIFAVLPFVLMFVGADAANNLINFQQCNTGEPPTGTCAWINGILNAGQSTYFEGMATPQRILYDNVTAGSHTVQFTLAWTKAGKHAYDFPVSWTQAVTLASTIGHFSLSMSDPCFDMTGDLATCRSGIYTQSVAFPTDNYISGQYALPATDGSTSAKIAAFEAAYGGSSTRALKIITNQPGVSVTIQSPVHSVANGADTGDTDVTYTINFTPTGSSPTMIMFLFAAHIAVSDAPGDPSAPTVTWGQGMGAKNISGAPYHVNNICIDGGGCTGGGNDNQLDLSGTPETPSLLTRISNASGTLNSPVSDTVTMTLSSSTVFSGQLKFYICGPAATANPCLPQYLTKTLVSTSSVSTTASSVTRSSSNYSPNQNGFWCFLAQWINEDYNTQSWETFSTTNECVSVTSATAVVLSSMQAVKSASGTRLAWSTGTEINMAGYNIYRSEGANGPYMRINSQIIATADKLAGAQYRYEDTTVQPGKTYYYQLEDVELNGTTTRHDPIKASVPEESAANANWIALGSILGAFTVVGGGSFIALKKLNVL